MVKSKGKVGRSRKNKQKQERNLDFSDDDIKVQLQKRIASGDDPVDLCIAKWKYIIRTKDWGVGEKASACALCVANNYDDENSGACKHCPLGLSGFGCLNTFSTFRSFINASSDEDRNRFALEMIDNLGKVKRGEKNMSSERDSENEARIKNLRRRLVRHLNYTKAVLSGIVFVPWLIGTCYFWLSQWYFTQTAVVMVKNSFTNKMVEQAEGFWSNNMIHDAPSTYLYWFGVIASILEILLDWYFVWDYWKEEED